MRRLGQLRVHLGARFQAAEKILQTLTNPQVNPYRSIRRLAVDAEQEKVRTNQFTLTFLTHSGL